MESFFSSAKSAKTPVQSNKQKNHGPPQENDSRRVKRANWGFLGSVMYIGYFFFYSVYYSNITIGIMLITPFFTLPSITH